jgi:hypothetical protein
MVSAELPLTDLLAADITPASTLLSRPFSVSLTSVVFTPNSGS